MNSAERYVIERLKDDRWRILDIGGITETQFSCQLVPMESSEGKKSNAVELVITFDLIKELYGYI